VNGVVWLVVWESGGERGPSISSSPRSVQLPLPTLAGRDTPARKWSKFTSPTAQDFQASPGCPERESTQRIRAFRSSRPANFRLHGEPPAESWGENERWKSALSSSCSSRPGVLCRLVVEQVAGSTLSPQL